VNRLVVAAALWSATVLAVSPVAGAAPAKSVSYTLTGSAEWNALFLPSSFAISGEVTDWHRSLGTYAGTVSAGTYTPSCADGPYGPNCAPASGSITLALEGGSITAVAEPGSLVNQRFTGPSLDPFVFLLTLSVTSGTRGYAHAHGTLSLVYDTTRNNLSPDPTGAPCYIDGVGTCPISDTGALTGTITR